MADRLAFLAAPNGDFLFRAARTGPSFFSVESSWWIDFFLVALLRRFQKNTANPRRTMVPRAAPIAIPALAPTLRAEVGCDELVAEPVVLATSGLASVSFGSMALYPSVRSE